jgi:uncharacterized membrane protein
MNPHKFLSKEERLKVNESIKAAELNTSGEIRVYIESRIKGDVLDRAAYIFRFLGMQKTKDRNGVLFYLAIENRKFAILGDAGINAKVPDNFWDEIKEKLSSHFTGGNFSDGLAESILMAGEQLKKHFPWKEKDVNELNDDISYGN